MSDLLRTRKDHHIDIVLEQPVASHAPALAFGRYTVEYDSLPEVDLDEVDLSCTLLGRRLRAPLVIGAMTGGTDRTAEINRTLARAAARVGVGMALGSQRPMIVHPEATASFAVRDAAPDLPLLIGNVGAVQLNYGVTVADLQRIVRDVAADALNFHLNPLQEAIQPEGDTRFRGLHSKLAEVMPEVGVPCVIKEVGAGIGPKAADKIASLPCAAVEVAGTGGTSWAAVESHRAEGDDLRAFVGQRLAGFGVPTIESLRVVRARLGNRPIIASGGLRTGMDAAVCLAEGAAAVAMAKPFLEAAMVSEDAVVTALEQVILELKVICFCAGAANLSALRKCRVIDARRGVEG